MKGKTNKKSKKLVERIERLKKENDTETLDLKDEKIGNASPQDKKKRAKIINNLKKPIKKWRFEMLNKE